MENFKVAQFMLEQRGVDRGSMITGSSVHNCRVERTHRDVYSGVLCFFARIFARLEDRGVLDPLNELHLFALHFTYIPRINKCLEEFKNQWENHPLSSEGNRSPLQLFTSGMLENEQSSYAGVASVFDSDSAHEYGFDPSGRFPAEEFLGSMFRFLLNRLQIWKVNAILYKKKTEVEKPLICIV